MNPPLPNQKYKGFTLIELSIVLVIIGLVVGGILVGNSLIAAAVIRAQLTQIESYNRAVNVFRDKFGGMPGDLVLTSAVQFGFVTSGCGGDTGGRDGNAQIQGGPTGGTNYRQVSGETALFWNDLTNPVAGRLIEGSYTTGVCTGNPSLTTTQYPLYWPQAKIGRSSYIYVYFDASGTAQNYYAINALQSVSGNPNPVVSLTVNEAFTMDSKIDDGNATKGRVLSQFIVLPGSTTTSVNANPDTAVSCYNTVTGNYSIAVNNGTGINCALSFQVN